jgi:hypothetical protein
MIERNGNGFYMAGLEIAHGYLLKIDNFLSVSAKAPIVKRY